MAEPARAGESVEFRQIGFRVFPTAAALLQARVPDQLELLATTTGGIAGEIAVVMLEPKLNTVGACFNLVRNDRSAILAESEIRQTAIGIEASRRKWRFAAEKRVIYRATGRRGGQQPTRQPVEGVESVPETAKRQAVFQRHVEGRYATDAREIVILRGAACGSNARF
jgi:hypothetical protein